MNNQVTDSNYCTTYEMTYDEKVSMYKKLSKLELINMLIESNRHLNNKPPVVIIPSESDDVMYSEICGCNPRNGGSGVCGCIMGNTIVKRGGQKEITTYYCNGDCSKSTGGCICKPIQTTTISKG